MRHPLFIFWIILISVHADVQSMASRFARLGTYAPEAFASLKNAWQPARSVATQAGERAGMSAQEMASKYASEIEAARKAQLKQALEEATLRYDLTLSRNSLDELVSRPVESQLQAIRWLWDFSRLDNRLEKLRREAMRDKNWDRGRFARDALARMQRDGATAYEGLQAGAAPLPEMTAGEKLGLNRGLAGAVGLTGLGLMGYGMYKAAPLYEEREKSS